MKSQRRFLVLVFVFMLGGGLIGSFASSISKGGGAGTDIKVADIFVDKKDCRLWVSYQNVGTTTIKATLREKTEVGGTVVENTLSAFDLAPGAYFSHGVGADPGYKLFGTNKSVTTRIDVDGVLSETNEANNVLTKTLGCSLIGLDKTPVTKKAPPCDLCIPYIKFVVVHEGDDAAGHYVTFNAIVYVKNIGEGGSGPFDTRLEHHINGVGPYLTCPTCKIHCAGLAAGAGIELPPRQYTKRGTQTSGQAIFFRATADCDNIRAESDETNNECKDSYQGQALHK